MIHKVNLVDIANNIIEKKVGFSFYYLFLGPFYLLFRLRFEGLILLILYYFLLPIPGLVELSNYLVSNSFFNNDFLKWLNDFILFFRSGWDHLQPYVCIILILIIHLMFAMSIDNLLLKENIKKKNWFPYSEEDARLLIYYHVVDYKVRLFKEVKSHQEVIKNASDNWEEKNYSFTSFINKDDINKNKKRRRLFSTNTSDLSKPYEKKLTTSEQNIIKKQHEDNLRLLTEKKITKEEFDILEERLNRK